MAKPKHPIRLADDTSAHEVSVNDGQPPSGTRRTRRKKPANADAEARNPGDETMTGVLTGPTPARAAHGRTGDRNSLPLTAGEGDAALTHQGIVTVG